MEENYEKIFKNIKFKKNNFNEKDLRMIFGKKDRKDNKTNYIFYKANIGQDIRSSLLSSLKENFKNLVNSKVITQFNDEDKESYVCFNLENINVWNQFEPVVYTDMTKFKQVNEENGELCNKRIHSIKNLKSLKYKLNHYILLLEFSDCILGQISRIYSRQVLSESKLSILYDEDKFSEIISDPRIDFDTHDSVLFFIDKNYKLGFTKNQREYEEIFDLYEQNINNAINTVKNSKFNDYCDSELVESIIKEDRTIARMLNKDLTIKGFDEFDISRVAETYTIVEDSVNFIFKDNQFELDSKNQKDSLKSVIKFIGYYYNQSLDDDYIIEGTPRNILKVRKK